MIALPPKNDQEGCETRILLAECRSPSFSGYSLADAIKCMQLMDRVLWNRLSNPAPYGAKGAKTIGDIVRARGQFAGFGEYPNYDTAIVHRIQTAIDIANNAKDKRSGDFTAYIQAAIDIAKGTRIADPSPGVLASWRTSGSGSPGANFKLHATVLGNAFYYIP